MPQDNKFLMQHFSRAIHLLTRMATLYIPDQDVIDKILPDSERNKTRIGVTSTEIMDAIEEYLDSKKAGIQRSLEELRGLEEEYKKKLSSSEGGLEEKSFEDKVAEVINHLKEMKLKDLYEKNEPQKEEGVNKK